MTMTTTILSSLIGTLLLPMLLFGQTNDYEARAKEILRLYESGKKDTAYILVEPLKKEARFVPAALYVRAQMTQDDRALGLYREAIALDPDGPWADESAWGLVRRYVEKRDSMAAHAWYAVLKKRYATSPYVEKAKQLVAGVRTWEIEMSDAASTADASVPAETVEDRFSGYALQVGLYPTTEAAEKRRAELEAKGLKPDIFPKGIDGRTQYALVVGPYSSLDEAGKEKANVAKICECGAFTVIVE